MSAPSQLSRAMRETCAQRRARIMFVLFGRPGTAHPAYLSAFNVVLPSLCVISNKSEAEILARANPSRNVWHEQRITSILGIWG
eukprot:9118302-Alexandrium_andersonii.AAC.1